MRGGGKRGGARIKRVSNGGGVTLREEGQSPHAYIQKPADDVREKEKQARQPSVRERGREEERKPGQEAGSQPASAWALLSLLIPQAAWTPGSPRAAPKMGTRAVVVPHPVWGLLGCCFFCSWALGDPRPLRSLPPLSSQVKPGSVPMWVPPEGAEAALAFLYSGDAQQLSGANCTERYEAHGAGARPGLPPVLWRAAGTLAQAANFLNMLLQANDIRESSVEEDVEWYQALVRSVAEGDPRAYRAFLIFNPPPGASHLQLALQATRIGEETILQDLSGSRVQEESPTGAPDTSALQKRVLTNDLGSLGSPKWPQGDGYVGDMQHVKLSPPFLECQAGRLRPGWLITLSATFYGLKPDLSPEVR